MIPEIGIQTDRDIIARDIARSSGLEDKDGSNKITINGRTEMTRVTPTIGTKIARGIAHNTSLEDREILANVSFALNSSL